jgi:vitamin B12 transporter
MKKLIAALVLLGAHVGHAQETPDTFKLKEIVVTATRLPTARSAVPAAVTVLYGSDLRERGVRTVDEALRAVSGAAVVQNGSYGANTSLFLRGGESDYVQVLIDGIQVNSPGEQFNWSNLSIENIERIEIVKGPSSVLYGSDAVTGVVQLITNEGARRSHGHLSLAGGRGDKVGAQATGSYGNATLEAQVSGGSSNVSYSAGLSHFGSEGAYAFNNEHRNSSATGRLGFTPGAATQLAATMRYDRNRFHYPTDGAGALTDRNQFHDGTSLALGVSAKHELSTAATLHLSLDHNRNDDLSDDRADTPADTIGFYRFRSDERYIRQTADARVDYRANRNSTLTVGTELEWQSNRGSSSSPFGDTPERTEKRNNKGFYAQWLGSFGRLSVQAGARTEDNQRFGGFTTYRGGLALHLNNEVIVRGNAGTGFKQPRFFEQFAQGFVIGNPDLKPERSRSIEGGIDFRRAKFTGSASYFVQHFKDLIQYTFTGNVNDPNYVNVAAADANGLEAEASWLVQRFRFSASYTNLHTKVTDQGDGSDPSFLNGEVLVRRPKHTGTLGVAGEWSRAKANLTANFVGERTDLDFAGFPAKRVTLPAYTRVDAAGQFDVTRRVAGTIKLENAFAAQYQEVLNFPARGRVAFVGVSLNW